jgi:hypothetical protein
LNNDVLIMVGKQVSVQLSGNNALNGILIDFGEDVLVLFNGKHYFYIPITHIHLIQLNTNTEDYVELPSDTTFLDKQGTLTYRKVLNEAKGIFTEISVNGNHSFHGQITDVLNNYLTFNSPIYKNLFISIDHVKWLIPYNQNTTPYTINMENPNLPSSTMSLKSSLEEQLKTKVGNLVVLDKGTNQLKSGLLKQVQNNMASIVVANGETVYINLNHVKFIQFP